MSGSTDSAAILALFTPEPHGEAVVRLAAESLQVMGGGTVVLLVPPGVDPAAERRACDQLRDHAELGGEISTARIDGGAELCEEVLLRAGKPRWDLIVVPQASMETQRLLRKVSCTLVVVPPESSDTSGPVLAPIDFRPSTIDAAHVAAKLARARRVPLALLHVAEVPIGYFKMGRTFEEFAGIMKQNAREKLEALSRALGGAAELHAIVQGDPAHAIIEHAANTRCSQIVMTNLRRTRAAALLLGSVTERVVLQAPCPVWAVRKSGTRYGLLEYAMGA